MTTALHLFKTSKKAKMYLEEYFDAMTRGKLSKSQMRIDSDSGDVHFFRGADDPSSVKGLMFDFVMIYERVPLDTIEVVLPNLKAEL